MLLSWRDQEYGIAVYYKHIHKIISQVYFWVAHFEKLLIYD